MKKIVKEQVKTISIDQITDDSIVGVEWKELGSKAIVLYNGPNFMGFSNLTKSIQSSWEEGSVVKYIEKCLRNGGTPYQFESVKECLKWMSE